MNLAYENTTLYLRAEGDRTSISPASNIYGRLHDHTFISCLNCVGGNTPSFRLSNDGKDSTSWEFFPHQVLIGDTHFYPDTDKITKVWFSTTDIHRIFNDYDSFGAIIEPPEILRKLIPEKIGERPTPIGPKPRIVYFSGREELLQSDLDFGILKVQHGLSREVRSERVSLTSHMHIQIEFTEPVNLEDLLAEFISLGQFFSLIAGRPQAIENIHFLKTTNSGEEKYLRLHWSLGPKLVGEQELDVPSHIDTPLDGIRRSEEFERVLKNWFNNKENALARSRLYACRLHGKNFNTDRLVAAANLFDLTFTEKMNTVSPELKSALEGCLSLLKATPNSYDRDSLIQAIKRVGSPTLMNKTLARAEIIRRYFILNNLDKVIRQAILCRNYFVHGEGDSRFNYSAAKPFISFLTETLEFVFATSELITCGWEANNWRLRNHTGHHWFVRFIHYYENDSQALIAALEAADLQKSKIASKK